jgi:hypothetical protein
MEVTALYWLSETVLYIHAHMGYHTAMAHVMELGKMAMEIYIIKSVLRIKLAL